MEFKYILIIFTAMCCLYHTINARNSNYYSGSLVKKRPGTDRVQIRVYRGPETVHGDKKFAPWGFLVRQPADDD